MNVRVFGVVTLAGLVVAGCSSGPSAIKTASPPRSTSTSEASSTTVPTTSPPTTGAPSTTTAPETQACLPTSLRVTLTSEQGAAGTGEYLFRAVNEGSASCQAGGYFGVSIYNQAGQLLTATDQRVATTSSGAGVRPIALSPGQAFTFQVGVGETPTGQTTTCPLIGAFHLIPPNETAFVQVSEPASAGYAYCMPDGLEVYPNQAGS